jgi:hypothetical protein
MNEWRERVRAGWAALQDEGDVLTTYDYINSAIAELLPLVKAKLANDLRDKHDGRLVSRMAIAAAIEAWEPEA